MKLMNVVALILSSLWVGGTSEIQLCHYGQETTVITSINMDSSPILGSTGMCSCRIELLDDANLTLYPFMTIPGCRTGVSLTDASYQFTCLDQRIENSFYSSEKKAGDVMWLFVTSTNVSQAMTGQLFIQTPFGSEFQLDCFDANTNTSETTMSIKTTTTLDQVTTSPATSSTTQTTLSHISTRRLEAECTTRSEDATAAIAGSIAGAVIVLVIIVTGSVIFHRRYRCIRRTESDQTPESRDHPTYCDLTMKEITEYAHIGHTEPKTVHQNVALDMSE